MYLKSTIFIVYVVEILIGLIVGLIIAFAIIKVTFTLTQNKRQKKIDEDLVQVNAKIDEYRTELGKKQDSYANVGELIATLPTSFDQQATSLDLDRMIILSGLSESSSNIRKIVEVSTLPVESSVSTVKAVQISFVLYGKVDDVESALKFMNYRLTIIVSFVSFSLPCTTAPVSPRCMRAGCGSPSPCATWM